MGLDCANPDNRFLAHQSWHVAQKGEDGWNSAMEIWLVLIKPFPRALKCVSTGPSTINEPLTLETCQPEKPTPSGFRAKNYKMRLGWNVLILLNPKFQVDWSTTSWDIHHWFGSSHFGFVLILHLILLFFSSNFTRSGSVSSHRLPQSAYLVLQH